jgi:hypothetical protein
MEEKGGSIQLCNHCILWCHKPLQKNDETKWMFYDHLVFFTFAMVISLSLLMKAFGFRR